VFALLGLLFPFIKGMLGDGLVEKVLAHKREQLASANELEKAKLNADIKMGEYELERRRAIRDLQIKEYEHPFMWWPKFLIMMAVAFYWFSVFAHVTLGLADFGIVIAELTPMQEAVSTTILAYMFLDGPIKRALRK
jgi:hypothetical protein